MTQYNTLAKTTLEQIRASKPVVHNITNYVVMNSTANVLLAMGASPIMAHAPEEVEELLSIASSLVINIGTLSRPWIDSMTLAARTCNTVQKPYVLDPVGSGATKLRTETAMTLTQEAPPKVIRGNASEVLSLSPEGGAARGVDSAHSVDQAVEAAQEVARALNTVVAVTGETDLVTDGKVSLKITGGHPLMGYVTGTGCAASVVVAAFLAMQEDAVAASACALAYFGLAGERAAAKADAPGSFWVHVLDELYRITPKELESNAGISAL